MIAEKICFACKYEPTWLPYNGSIWAGFCKYPLPVYIKNARILMTQERKLYYQSKGYSHGHNDLGQSGGGYTTESAPFTSCRGFKAKE